VLVYATRGSLTRRNHPSRARIKTKSLQQQIHILLRYTLSSFYKLVGVGVGEASGGMGNLSCTL